MSGYLSRLAARTGLGQAATSSPAIAEQSTGSPMIAEGAPAPASIEIEPAAQPVAPIPGPWPDPDRLLDDARPVARQEADSNVATTGQTAPHPAPLADWPKDRPAMEDPASAGQAGPLAAATVETPAPDRWAVSPPMPVDLEAPALATPNPGNVPRPREAEDRYPAPRSPEPSIGPFAAAAPRPPDAQLPVARTDHRRTGGDGIEVKIGSVSLEIVYRPASPEPPPAPPPPARRAAWAGDIGVLRRLHVRGV